MVSSWFMRKGYFKIIIAYLVAGMAVVLFGRMVGHWHPVLIVAVADLAGTLVIFGFSIHYDNSSTYDPYWSVVPILIGFYWLTSGIFFPDNWIRQVAVMALVLIWAVRLTLNWAVRWRGMTHEDWRYVDLRNQHGRMYWVVSFFGIHLMPTVLVFLGCLSMLPSLSKPASGFGALDLVAILVTVTAIWFEFRADLDLNRFIQAKKDPGQLLRSGIWSISRHPNYFGEILFWWGLYLFALAANPRYWWTVIGPLSISALFIFISIPMIEKRMLTRKPEYADYIKSTPILIPWSRKK
jgi:steroid 5-alpha reductase family enzyme